MDQQKIVSLEDRIPKLKLQRKQRANRRLIMYLSLFFFLLLIVIYFQSSFSDIRNVVVTGNRYVLEEQIILQVGLHERTGFWSINKDEMISNLTSLDEVKEVSITKSFPNTIEIHIEEYMRVAYLVNEGLYFPILESGKVLEQIEIGSIPADAPLLVNWSADQILEEMAAELTKVSESIKQRISEIYHTPIESDPLRITLYMNDGNEVSSTVRQFSNKISSYPAIVKQLDSNKRGIIHMKMNPYFELFDYEEASDSESEG